MKNLKDRLKKIEQREKGEEITITLGNDSCTFKNAEELSRLWIEAVIANDEDDKKRKQASKSRQPPLQVVV